MVSPDALRGLASQVMDTGSYMFAVRCDSGLHPLVSSDVRVHLKPNGPGSAAGYHSPSLVLDTLLPAALFVLGSLAGVVIAYKEW
jgi:hypothetical protein